MEPPWDERTSIGAMVLAALSWVGVQVWRAWFRARSDLRGDARSQQELQGDQRRHETDGELIERLWAEIDRLAKQLDDVSRRFSEEQRLRFEAEAQAAELRLRVRTLEQQMAELRGTTA